ncbi:TraM recognition domain-containing protein [Planotetraspora sp. A-T 1434]|uniref:type IV secretory system conjugative DNA transfer family protein n=1 Tax=Planotetraspora sp. A-T 1434 TaxID=2979219 RepID=UPI0021C11AC3|nr:TraM recognition domain-containing protein [Planotetraspora sp. A-T 1434]MCT9934513.1 TraM recognition domain-containing protein [Planotetraspora sp. A-T 1434]
MTRAVGPRAGLTPQGAIGGWVLLLAGWGVVAFFGLIWISARITAVLFGGRVSDFGTDFALEVFEGRTAAAWPGTPTPAVVVVAALLITTALAIGVGAWWFIVGRRPDPVDPVAALADNPGLTVLKPDAAERKARELRRSLTGPLAPCDIGLALGDLMRNGPTLYASWEDTIVAFMAPRSGKTTCLSIPYVLSAPGPVIATSNKADLWAATAALRAADGAVWLFDPQHITYQPQAWWWDPLRGLSTVEDAHRLAGHFVLTVDDGNKRDLWGPAAQDLLCALFLAAASSGRTLREVAKWLDTPAVPTPVELLEAAGFTLLASSLRGAQNGAVETRDGIYQTARTAAKALRDEAIISWVTPSPLPVFDPHDFASGNDTLYLLSKSRSAAAPLIAALTDTAMRAAERRAERMGGRLDPPMVVSLDEAANICRIADLPELYSHLGSRGIVPVTILQSYEQGVTVWGETGMAAMWGAATRKVIGAGVDSPRLARDLATLVGQHDVPVRSVTYAEGRASEQISLRRQDILEPAAIRALPPGTALLLATGGRPALISLLPWYQSRDADRIQACRDRLERLIAERAAR